MGFCVGRGGGYTAKFRKGKVLYKRRFFAISEQFMAFLCIFVHFVPQLPRQMTPANSERRRAVSGVQRTGLGRVAAPWSFMWVALAAIMLKIIRSCGV